MGRNWVVVVTLLCAAWSRGAAAGGSPVEIPASVQAPKAPGASQHSVAALPPSVVDGGLPNHVVGAMAWAQEQARQTASAPVPMGTLAGQPPAREHFFGAPNHVVGAMAWAEQHALGAVARITAELGLGRGGGGEAEPSATEGPVGAQILAAPQGQGRGAWIDRALAWRMAPVVRIADHGGPWQAFVAGIREKARGLLSWLNGALDQALAARLAPAVLGGEGRLRKHD